MKINLTMPLLLINLLVCSCAGLKNTGVGYAHGQRYVLEISLLPGCNISDLDLEGEWLWPQSCQSASMVSSWPGQAGRVVELIVYGQQHAEQLINALQIGGQIEKVALIAK
jgi:hypothetical protein